MKITIHNPWVLPVVFIGMALVMSVYELTKEVLFEGSLTPWESHTITIIFTSLLATLSTSVMRSWVLAISAKEKEVEAKHQALISIELMLSAVNHIVNNVLHNFKILRLDIDNTGEMQEKRLEMLELSIKEAANQMARLNKIKNPSDPSSYLDIYPNYNKLN